MTEKLWNRFPFPLVSFILSIFLVTPPRQWIKWRTKIAIDLQASEFVELSNSHYSSTEKDCIQLSFHRILSHFGFEFFALCLIRKNLQILAIPKMKWQTRGGGRAEKKKENRSKTILDERKIKKKESGEKVNGFSTWLSLL